MLKTKRPVFQLISQSVSQSVSQSAHRSATQSNITVVPSLQAQSDAVVDIKKFDGYLWNFDNLFNIQNIIRFELGQHLRIFSLCYLLPCSSRVLQ